MAKFNIIECTAAEGSEYNHDGGALTFAADADVALFWRAVNGPEGELAQLTGGDAETIKIGAGRIRFDSLVDCLISVGRAS